MRFFSEKTPTTNFLFAAAFNIFAYLYMSVLPITTLPLPPDVGVVIFLLVIVGAFWFWLVKFTDKAGYYALAAPIIFVLLRFYTNPDAVLYISPHERQGLGFGTPSPADFALLFTVFIFICQAVLCWVKKLVWKIFYPTK